jgi:hypothetical protein
MAPLVPLARVNLQKVYGGWYTLATIPNFPERGVVESCDHYSPPPGGIREDFYMRRGGFDDEGQHFVLDSLPGTNNEDWRV